MHLSGRTARTQPSSPRWTALQRREGPAFLRWLDDGHVLEKGFCAMASALRAVLQSEVHTCGDARKVWSAVPAVLNRCNKSATYALAGAAPAYAWLHLLDRYVRTWWGLRLLVKRRLLPMGKEGVRVLDVGTGPGPSAFATHDFYATMVKFADTTGKEDWRQPPTVTCVESSDSMNRLRHHLAEILHVQGAPKSVLDMCGYITDFESIHPRREREKMNKALRNAYDDYLDPDTGQWESERLHTPEEANRAANVLHRYRLFTFSNFLTTPLTVDRFRENLTEVLTDANPGSVLLTIGGTGYQYKEVDQRVAALARDSGFARRAKRFLVSSSRAGMDKLVFAEGADFYRKLKAIATCLPVNDLDAKKAKAYFEGSNGIRSHSSAVRAYRK